MKKCISKKETFENFLDHTIKNIFQKAINKGRKKDISGIFICFWNLKKNIWKKSENKIKEALLIIENTTYKCDEELERNEQIENSSKATLSPKRINANNNCSIFFKEKKVFLLMKTL